MAGETRQEADGRNRTRGARRSREDVAAWQRHRMLTAMVAAVAEKGYANVAVADVVRRAQVSRATFYEQFEDKTDCFVAAFHWCVDQFVVRLHERNPPGPPPRRRLHTLLSAYLGEMAEFPDGARVCLVELYAVGPQAALHRRQIQLDFVAMLRELHTELAAAGEPVRPLDDFDFEALVGAISSLATNKIAAGEAADLPNLLAPLETFVLNHFGLDPPADR
ncbi:MAG TPA: TetR/AcrR family transcriptional regulator [Acidimicrobiales bacterium]|nr:TetR/AcrR family transcriptional regulator [Acidimicrobiales bacterium]